MMSLPHRRHLIGAPAPKLHRRQSAEGCAGCVRPFVSTGAVLKNDNGYGIEQKNGSPVLALLGSDSCPAGVLVNELDDSAFETLTVSAVSSFLPIERLCPPFRRHR
jgi:hypothetical protein